MTKIIDITLPAENSEGTKNVLSKWLRKEGESVNQHDPIIEVNTDKVVIEIPAPASGTLIKIMRPEQDEISPGDVLGQIALGAESKIPSAASKDGVKLAAPTSSPNLAFEADGGEDLLSPAVKKLIREHALNIRDITGTGRAGRVTHQDVLNHLHDLEVKAGSSSASLPADLPSHKVPHTQMRRMIADHITDSLLHKAPHVTALFEVNLAQVLADRERTKTEFAKQGCKLTLSAYFIKAIVDAIKVVPQVNATYQKDYLEIYDQINIGVGTALEEEGLIVPVIKAAEKLDLFAIASQLQDLTERAREGKLTAKELQGGTFTVSNHGVSGTLLAAPIIINQPQVAILGIGKIEKRVKVISDSEGDTTAILPCCYVTLTIDYRALDGFQANKFLTHLCSSLENWQS